MSELSEEGRERAAAESKRRTRLWLTSSAAFILPIVAHAVGFPEAGPYLFAWFIVMSLALIVDGQIDEVKRTRGY